MNILSSAVSQVRELLSSMTPAGRITTGLLLIAVVVSLAYLFRTGVGGGEEYLLGGRPLSGSEIAAAEAAFAKVGLSDYEIEGTRILIPRGHKAAYIGAMADAAALPPDFNVYLDEAVKSGGPFDSRDMRDARLKNARQKELALILRSMQGIDSATVQFDVVERGGFPPKKEYTAMVAVRPTAGADMTEDSVRSIRHLVSSAIAGLSASSVTVNDLQTGITYPGGDSLGPGAAENNAYAMAKRTHEQRYLAKVREVVSFIRGAIVAVNVEMDPEMDYRSTNTNYDGKPVAYRNRDWTKSETNAAASAGGRPGLAGQQPNQPTALSVPANESTREENQTEQDSVVGAEHTYLAKASLVPKKMSVSIGVPSTYYVEVWRSRKRRNGEEVGAEDKPSDNDIETIEQALRIRLQNAIAPLLPQFEVGKEVWPEIAVHTYDPETAPGDPEPAISQSAFAWLTDHWQTLALLAIGGVGLLMVRGMVKAAVGVAPAVAAPDGDGLDLSDATATEVDDEEDEGPISALRQQFQEDGPNLREELSGLVKKDPDAAAAILKSWIGGGA